MLSNERKIFFFGKKILCKLRMETPKKDKTEKELFLSFVLSKQTIFFIVFAIN